MLSVAVIDYNDFIVLIALAENAVDGFSNVAIGIVSGNDDTDSGLASSC